jgi:predicted transcriptional regulator
LACCDRVIRIHRTPEIPKKRPYGFYPEDPQTWGEHLRKKRLDMRLSMKKLAQLLGNPGNSPHTIKDWEMKGTHPRPENRKRIIEFLGFDPTAQIQQRSRVT